jgi:hypothetical protein
VALIALENRVAPPPSAVDLVLVDLFWFCLIANG